MLAITLTFPPHSSQDSISMPKTCLRRCAHVIARCRSAGGRGSVAVGFPRPAGVTSARHRLCHCIAIKVEVHHIFRLGATLKDDAGREGRAEWSEDQFLTSRL